MKRIVFLLIFIMISTVVVHAQGRELRRADRQLNRGNLADAMEYLQEAREHESVFEDPEYWMIKARLHLEIAVTEEEEYKNLAENPVLIADEAMQKVKELDADNDYILEIQPIMLYLSELTFNLGANAYEREAWNEASDHFLRAYEIGLSLDAIDTTTYYYAGLTAEIGRNFPRAYEIYTKLEEMDYEEPILYSSLSNVALALGDTLEGTEYALKGRELYPENLDLIFAEANIHIFTGDMGKARDILDLAIEKDPENPNLYFAFAANYDKMAQDTTYTDEERQFAFEEAIKAYEQAIELNPDYFDAVYNLGVMYFNKGIRIFDEADENLRQTHDFAQYEKDEKAFKEVWLQAQPYLERSKEMIDENDPNFQVVILSLVELYARTDQPEKMKEIENLYKKYFDEEPIEVE
jgi:tetratricopeptide (TPR) repeat protein